VNNGQLRRAKRSYITLAAFLAAQPPTIDRVELSLNEIEDVLGDPLPPHAAFPFWWNNEGLSAHSRAWLASKWEVEVMDKRARRVTFVRRST
jgi:hypothetical protein